MGNEFSFDIKEICNTKNVLSQNNIKKFRKDFLKFSPKEINEISEKFSSIPLVSAAIETIACLFKQLDNKKAIEVKQFLIQQLIYSYPYKNYKDHKLLAPYKIIEKPNFIEYTLNGEPVAGAQNKVISKKTETLITKIQLMSFAFQCSILNRSDEEVTKEIFKYIITAISLYFRNPNENYLKCAKYLLPVIKLIEPKPQLLIIQGLIPYIKSSLDLSDEFADLLTENKILKLQRLYHSTLQFCRDVEERLI